METATLHTYGPWGQPYKVTKTLCPDGIRRTARITGEADTFFSIPASVKAYGKTVSGFITGRETDDGERDYEFIPYAYRKNHTVFAYWVTLNAHEASASQAGFVAAYYPQRALIEQANPDVWTLDWDLDTEQGL